MSKLRVGCFSLSLDGFGAGPNQSPDNPLGEGGEALHEWIVPTRTFQQVHGKEGGTTGVDDELAARVHANIGAWIMGRNMFGPVRGPWPDENWKGWWGDNPPFHCPVFVLTHHVRAPITMVGGTIFHFVTDGIEAALERAVQAANGKDVLVGGGVATVRQYLRAGLIDEMHLAISPVLLGAGEHLFANIDTAGLGYRCTEHAPTQNATHVVLTRQERKITSTLYLHPFSSYCHMEIAFYEKGVAFETKMLDGSEPVADEFAALWAIGKFPVLALAAEWQQLGEPMERMFSK